MASARSLFVMVSGMLVGLLLTAGSSQANEVEFDRYVVHYAAVNTAFLSPEVARAYNLRRSSNRALVNVVIMKREGSGIETLPGNVSGQAVNLTGQVRRLSFREVRDGDAFYHLAEVPVRPGEVLDFDLRVTALGSDEVMPVRFRQTFYPY
jgi:hypothetical protein